MTCHCCHAETPDPLHRVLDGEVRHVCEPCAESIDEALVLDGLSANPADPVLKGG